MVGTNWLDYEEMRRFTVNAKGVETLRMKQSRFVRMVALLISFADSRGYEMSFGPAFTSQGHVEGSLHFLRLAIDLNVFREGKYMKVHGDYNDLGDFWESIGGIWGGRWGDDNHFSLGYMGRR